MRLTLRTLLAYMDDILDPEDAQEIAKRIADSPVATDLMHRVRDVMRRLRLGAPNVLDRGAGLDPNTVAEYLDHMLSDAQVPDFEKVCLESDVQLAEVASCHRILALVLGEPAEVDPESRQRVYQLPDLLAAKAKTPEATEVARAPAAGVPEPAARSAPESRTMAPKSRIPGYLREPPRARQSWWSIAALAVAILAVIVALDLSGQLGGRSLVKRFLGTEPSVAETGQPLARGLGPAQPAPRLPEEPTADAKRPDGETPGKRQGDAAEFGSPGKVLKPAPPPAARADAGAGKTASQDTPDSLSEPGRAKTGVQPTGQARPAIAPAGPPGGDPGATKGESPLRPGKAGAGRAGDDLRPQGKSGPEGRDLAGSTLAQPGGAIGAESRPPSLTPPAARPAPKAKPQPAEPVAVVISPKEVLLGADRASGLWYRLAAKTPIAPGERLLSLPPFRPVVSLAGQVQLQLLDGSAIEFLAPDAAGVVGLRVEQGRLILRAEHLPDKGPSGEVRLRLQVGERSGVLRFTEVESTLAIESRRLEGRGGDPETQPGPLVTDLYATSGKIVWEDNQDGKPVPLDAPRRHTMSDPPLVAEVTQQFPKWVFSDTTSPLDQRGAPILERDLTVGKPANLVLRELVGHRLKEVRMLAVRGLAWFGDYEPLLKVLNDPEQKVASWVDAIEQLRAAVVRSPQAAAGVRAAMEELFGMEGTGLYAMLWKYRLETFQEAEAAQLTTYLDHQALAFRVLSSWNLKKLTGLTMPYRAEDPSAKRQVAIQKWRARLKIAPAPRGDTLLDRGGLPETKAPERSKPSGKAASE